MTTNEQAGGNYRISRGAQHNYIMDSQGNYVAKSFDTSREGLQRIERLVERANAATLTESRKEGR